MAMCFLATCPTGTVGMKLLFEEEVNQDLLGVGFAVIFISLLISQNYMSRPSRYSLQKKKSFQNIFYMVSLQDVNGYYSQGASVLKEGWFG